MEKISKNLLQSLNLTEAQARVYLASLELGQATVQALAKKSGVKRSTIYTFLDELKERQLLTETRKGKRNLFSAANPAQLIEHEKNRLTEIQALLPELLAIHNKSRTKPRVTFFEGVQGVKEVYTDTLRDKKDMVGWSDYEYSKKVLGPYYNQYAKERAQRGIWYSGIVRDTSAARERFTSSSKQWREIRLSKISDDIVTETYIYGDKVAHISFRSSPVFAVIIEDPAITRTLRAIWKFSWESSQSFEVLQSTDM